MSLTPRFVLLLLSGLLVGMLAFVAYANHIHNNPLATSSWNLASQFAAAILTATTITLNKPPTPPA